MLLTLMMDCSGSASEYYFTLHYSTPADRQIDTLSIINFSVTCVCVCGPEVVTFSRLKFLYLFSMTLMVSGRGQK